MAEGAMHRRTDPNLHRAIGMRIRVVSELKRSRADSDAVEFLVGHSLGLRGVYTDPSALPLREAVGLVPRLGAGSAVIHLVGT